jgi:trichoplein keratin filament-binding protein
MSESIEFKEEKRERIKQRQKNLKDFIDKENLELESELKELRLANGGDDTERSVSRTTNIIETLRTKAENLKQIREEDRKKVAEEKLYQHWRLNNPEIRDLDSKKFSDYIVDQWSGQVSERNEVVERERQMDSEYVRYLESEREKAAEKDAELRRLKLSRDLELKEILRQQMIELKQKEAEQEIFEREEYELMQDKYQMDRLDSVRKEMEKQHANKEYGRQLLRQHTAKLRKRAKEIQDALEFDLNILKQVASMQESQRNVDESRRAQAKADADYMIRVFNEQLRLEKEREAEIDTMFQDEAAREWQKRNAEWERESLAREKLMNEVLNERKQQIADKFEIIQQKKLESIQQREVLIKDMEQTQMLAQRERDKLERAKVERKQDFQSQVGCLLLLRFAKNKRQMQLSVYSFFSFSSPHAKNKSNRSTWKRSRISNKSKSNSRFTRILSKRKKKNTFKPNSSQK